MQKIVTKQGFPHALSVRLIPRQCHDMQNPKSLSDLLKGSGKRLSALKTRSLERSLVVEHVRAMLPARLALAVASAGIDQNRLTIGVIGAVWASRLRYLTESIRKRITAETGVALVGVKIRIVPPPAADSPKP